MTGSNSDDSSTRAYRFAVIILAAGQSTRMGDMNKLLQHYRGQSMISRITKTATKICSNVLVVLGHQANKIKIELSTYPVTFVQNPDYTTGLSSSLAAGIRALPPEIDATLICLGDMPKVSASHLGKLIESYDPQNNHSICLPVFSGKRGNPVLWGSQYFPELLKVEGDKGARNLLGKFDDQILEVQMEDDGVHFDIDTCAELFESPR